LEYRNSDEVGAIYAATAQSSVGDAHDSSSGRTRVQGAQPQPAIVQGQNQIHVQPGEQAVERAPVPAAGFQAHATLARPEKSTVTSAGKVSQAGLRGSLGAVTGSQAEPGNHPHQAETSGPAPDASALVRDSAGTHGAISGNTGGTTGIAAGSTARETFAALDADTRTGTPSWIHAGARRAEAGFQDPALGWVGVRADVNGSGVHATVMPGSSDAAQALGGHMAGLNAYLAEEHTPVETLTLAMPEGGESALGAGQNAGQGMNQGTRQNGSSESQSNSQPVMPAIAAAVSREMPELTGNLGRIVGVQGHESSHISVMA
jgi:hypothetical protein